MASFDVVVPCYNYARFLERCVASVLNQEDADVRVLIIDDCSSDDSAVVGQRLADADPRVEFRRHEVNKGHIATYNEGLIGWAKADYSLLLSADDGLAPGAFKRALPLFEGSPEVGLVFGTAKITTRDDEFSFPPDNDFESTQVVPGEAFLKYCCENTLNPVPTSTAIVRTKWQQRLGGYRSDLPHSGDMEMWMRFASHGRIGLVRSVQGEYRQHDRNMSQNYYARAVGDRQEFALTCRKALDPILPTIPEARQWLEAMHAVISFYASQNALAAFERGDVEAFEALYSLEREMSAHMEAPRQYPRLKIRKLLGHKVWSVLRGAQKALGRQVSKPEPLNVTGLPTHGDLIGWWPERQSDPLPNTALSDAGNSSL